MKKLFRIIVMVFCMCVVVGLTACSDPGAPDHAVSSPKYTVSAETLENKLAKFIFGRENRTSFTPHEKKAAEFLRDELISYGYEDNAENGGMIRTFESVESESRVLSSQNVVAVYRPSGVVGKKNVKNVIIGAYYDNRYAAPYTNATSGSSSHGVLGNGTGVATALAIAEYLENEKPELGFTVTFVFFGASAVKNTGVVQYYDKHMTADEKRNTVLMIELQRIGVDHVYAFSDYRETKREKFFDGIAKANSLDIYKPTQKSPIILSGYVLDGIPFFQWAMFGNFEVFFNKNIPTLNIVGANWETIDLTDTESAEHDNVVMTAADTLVNLKKNHPDYGKKMATAATLVIESLKSPKFLPTMEYDYANFPDTSVLNSDWIWYLVVLGVLLIGAAIMTLINAHLAKKYPPAPPPQIRGMKLAVFGMDYEDKDPDKVYIDIKNAPPQGGDEIFPGVPNNETTFVPKPPIMMFSPFMGTDIPPSHDETDSPVHSDESGNEGETNAEDANSDSAIAADSTAHADETPDSPSSPAETTSSQSSSDADGDGEDKKE